MKPEEMIKKLSQLKVTAKKATSNRLILMLWICCVTPVHWWFVEQ